MKTPTIDKNSVQGRAAVLLDGLRSSYAACKRALAEYANRDSAASELKEAERNCERAIGTLKSLAKQSKDDFEKLAKQKFASGRDYREFKFDQQLTYEAKLPDTLKPVALVIATLLGEGTAAGFMMALEGHMGVAAGMVYGYTFALVNIALGLTCGLLCVRYMDYRSTSQTPDTRDSRVRFTAQLGFWFFTGLMALLVYSAMRTRALGGHSDIFNFELLGFFATFNDSIAIAIGALGILGSIVSIYEGATGFSDPIPGYTEKRKQAELYVDDDALANKDDLLDDIDDVFETAQDQHQTSRDAIKDSARKAEQSLLTLISQWNAHNNQVAHSKDEVRVFAQERSHIEGKRIYVNTKAFDAYLLPLDEIPASTNHAVITLPESDALDRLAEARSSAVMAVNRAYDDYLDYSPNFDDDLEEGDSNDLA